MEAGQKFFVYRNIHKGKDQHTYSLRSKLDNRVKGHLQNFFLENAKLKVSEKGRDRVRSEGVKNVHAGVEGVFADKKHQGEWVKLKYNPKIDDGFTRADNGKMITQTNIVKFEPSGIYMLKSAFYKSFLKHAKALRKEVSTVAVMKDGKMLMGKRRDNGKWTAPGGHLERGEDPLDGAVRELFEESGIKVDPKDLKFIKTITNKDNGYTVHGYRYDVDDKISTSMKNDPDNEVYRWHFKDTTTIPDKELHVPRTSGNVLLPEMEKSAKEILKGGKGDNKPDSSFDQKQLSMGIDVEMEHTPSQLLAKEIAKDHLTEIPDYYTRLKKMEKGALEKGFLGAP
jgi:8-oxo-dGTP pyrophosphatase MutT (NUDIX family)